MQVSNNQTNYQNMNIYQQATPIDISKNALEKPNSSQYASIEPVPSTPVEEVKLTPEEQLNQEREVQSAKDIQEAEQQAKQDSQRDYAAGYMNKKSTQSQVEIYLAVATDSKTEIDNKDSTTSIIQTLREVQKQNNTVEAYATYAQNQKSGNSLLGY